MKSIFSTAAAVAMLGCLTFTASAVDSGKAVAAQFHIQGSNKPTEFDAVNTPTTSKKGGMFGNFDAIGNDEFQWQVLNIPVRVGAGKVAAPGGDKVIPNYVPEITFHVYLCLEATMVDKSGKSISDKRKSVIVLDKEITYVNIPLKKAAGNTMVGTASVDACADMMVAVFLSPRDVARITEDDTKPATLGGKTQPKVKVAAVAMEASYKGASCWRAPKNEKLDYLAIDTTICGSLPDKWWKKSSAPTKSASLSCISETPFASEYYPYYCATKPLYGAPTGSSSSSSSDSMSDDTGTTATDDTTTDNTATDDTTDVTDDTADDSSTSSKGKRKKDKKDKKRK